MVVSVCIYGHVFICKNNVQLYNVCPICTNCQKKHGSGSQEVPITMTTLAQGFYLGRAQLKKRA